MSDTYTGPLFEASEDGMASTQVTRCLFDGDIVPPGYFDRLVEQLKTLPDAVEAPGEDPEPMI
jgi:hypothetical protein